MRSETAGTEQTPVLRKECRHDKETSSFFPVGIHL